MIITLRQPPFLGGLPPPPPLRFFGALALLPRPLYGFMLRGGGLVSQPQMLNSCPLVVPTVPRLFYHNSRTWTIPARGEPREDLKQSAVLAVNLTSLGWLRFLTTTVTRVLHHFYPRSLPRASRGGLPVQPNGVRVNAENARDLARALPHQPQLDYPYPALVAQSLNDLRGLLTRVYYVHTVDRLTTTYVTAHLLHETRGLAPLSSRVDPVDSVLARPAPDLSHRYPRTTRTTTSPLTQISGL